MQTEPNVEIKSDAQPQQLGLWKKQRTITKTNADREAQKCSDIISSFDLSQYDDLTVSKSKLISYLQKLQDLNEKILPYSKDDEVDDELADSNQREQYIVDIIFRAEICLKKPEVNNTSPKSPSRPSSPGPSPEWNITKLPKLFIHPFNGNCLKWREFWDSFNVSVHCKNNLSSIQKFQYLKSFLRGEAYRLIEGYTLSSDTYDTAVAALGERYNHPEWCINIHLDTMIYMKECENTVEDIQKTLDSCEAHIRGLVSLGLTEETFERVFAPLVLSKFPRPIRIELNRRNAAAGWSLSNLRKHLKEEILARQLGLQTVGGQPDKSFLKEKQPANRNQRDTRGTASTLLSSASGINPHKQPRYPCAFCKVQGHFPEDCKKVSNAADRYNALESRQCLLCLSPYHRNSECMSDRPCRICGIKRSHHHSLCHKKYGVKKPSPSTSNVEGRAKSAAPAGSLMAATTSSKDTNNHTRGFAILGTTSANAVGLHGTTRVQIALDNCSTRSFARLELLERVGAKLLSEEYLGLARLDYSVRRHDKFRSYELTIQGQSGEEFTLIVNGLQNITCPIEKYQLSEHQYPLLQQFGLNSSTQNCSQSVRLDVLIGLDQYYRIVSNIAVRLSDTLVILDTKLGYIVNGCSEAIDQPKDANATIMLAIDKCSPDDILNDRLQKFWELEDAGLQQSVAKHEDLIAEEKFLKEIAYDAATSRYSVRWPWKEPRQPLPINYGLALGRLKGLLRNLDHRTLTVYDQTIQEQRDKGMIEAAPDIPTGDQVYYIPHHCVVRPDHSTTKLRIVYDAAAKPCKSDQSLNESMYSGPTQLNDLCGLLVRFRQHRVGLASDIEKAFLQVSIKPVDRDVTRFLWVKDINTPALTYNLVTYRFTRVLFGVTASPYMLSGTIKYHLARQNTATAWNILNNCYVDNVVTGVDTTEEAQSFYHEAKATFSSASMNLRQWISNDHEFLNRIRSTDRCSEPATSILGLQWNISADTLNCKSREPRKSCNTKRELLHTIAKLFDPCGFLQPVTIVGKLLLQELWRQQLHWDTYFSEALQKKCQLFIQDFQKTQLITVPRYVGGSSDASVQLHCFVDASMQAYSAVVYQRNHWQSSIQSHLVFSNAKLSPLKTKLTIPKLELTAIALGSKLVSFIRNQIQRPISETFLWTDSQCALHWIARDANLPIYIRNRVSEIKKVSDITIRYVPSSQNPADLPTKGLTTSKIKDSSLWWFGPDYLCQAGSQWPPMPAELVSCSEADCCRTSNQATACLTESEQLTFPFDINRVSSLQKAVAVLAWTFRFTNRSRKKQDIAPHHLTVDERQASLRHLIRATQYEFAIANPEDHRQSIKTLRLFVDPSGLLRCSGYLDNSRASYDTCFPIYIPRHSPLCKLIIKDVHKQLGHDGMQHILSELRAKFWIPKARSTSKTVLTDCTVCRRWKGGPFRTPNAPPLPEFRVEEQPSFSAVGVDYLGPLMVRGDKETRSKVWICLFCCCVTRAIHLEVVTDMTAEQFLLCFRRFIAHRGRPALIVSDNAKNFHLASKVMNTLWNSVITHSSIQTESSRMEIQWKFIVEFAPWMGGMYERLVGLVKRSLKCMLQGKLVNLSELQTLCAEAAVIINTRPLTYTEDHIGFRGLTPMDLQRNVSCALPYSSGKSDPVTCSTTTQSTKSDLIRRWKCVDARINEFWKRFHKEYLVSLRERSWHHYNMGATDVRPVPGMAVVIGDPGVPRGQWMLGRIDRVIASGSDGQIRSVMVATTRGKLLHRPLKRVYPLEVDDTIDDRDLQDTNRKEDAQTDLSAVPGNTSETIADTDSRNQAGGNIPVVSDQTRSNQTSHASPIQDEAKMSRARLIRSAAQSARKRWQCQLNNTTL